MKIKKLIAICLITTGVLLTACQKNVNTNIPEETREAENSVDNENTPAALDEKAKEDSGDVSADSVEEAEEVKVLHLMKDCKSIDYWDEETYDYYMSYEDERILLTEEDASDYPALAATLEAELKKRNASYQADIDRLIDSYLEEKGYGFHVGYETKSELSIERADTVVLSVRESASEYTGGAHGMYGSFGYNYDTQTGQVLKFSDVVADPVAFLKLANEKIQEPYSGDFEVPASLDDYYDDYDYSIIWTIDYTGVKLYFNPYTLGSYALGMIETEIYFSEAPELFNPKYLNIPESYAIELDGVEPSWIDINDDGVNEKITIINKYDNDYGYVNGVDIEVGDNTFSYEDETDHIYYVSYKGNKYLLVSYAYDGIYWVISTIDLSTMTKDTDHETDGLLASYMDEWTDEDGRSESDSVRAIFTDPNKVYISTYIQYLGTMMGTDYYHMGEEKCLVADTGIFMFENNNVLTAKTDIDCEQVDLDGNAKGKAKIPAGTKLVVRRGDGESFADLIEVPADAEVSDYDYFDYLETELKLEDADVIYRVKGELGEYGSMAVINGQEEYEVFDKIMYAD